ncbi:hypothetical protein H5V45_16595 [Nocardioides sp. KIGAM211]|uniref:Uncharacterized protein n=1 Tax=Nocardioides luti TaxID=2761101 RepID=A0A7X0VBQ8_9ACTN|nr:hypothetical protein [Nocardioides luti]MBB6628946.1 hypothetical protein [Nocardioides luti]
MRAHDDLDWQRLLAYVGSWALVREVPGGLEVTFETADGAPRTVEVVMTPDEWSTHLGVVHGSDDPGVTWLRERVLATPEGTAFLVFSTHDWEPSPTRELPEEPDGGPGEWFVRNRDGSVSYFRDALEPD